MQLKLEVMAKLRSWVSSGSRMVMPLPDCSTLPRERAVGVAGDRKVMDIAHELARKINRSHAFRAIAGPAE